MDRRRLREILFLLAVIAGITAVMLLASCGGSGPCDPPNGWAYVTCQSRGGFITGAPTIRS